MTRQGKIRYRKNQRNNQETKDGDTQNSVPVEHNEDHDNNEEIRGRHPTEVTYIWGCTPMYYQKRSKNTPINPEELARDIFRKFTLKVFNTHNIGAAYSKNLKFNSRDDNIRQYFNKMHRALNYEETAHFCGKFPDIIYSIACRDIDQNDLRETSLTRRCLNYIHRNLALTYRLSDESIFVTYHYQPQMIMKLPIPETIKGALLTLYTKCRIHCQTAGIIMSKEEHQKKYFYRKGTYAFEQLEKIFNQRDQSYKLYKLYTIDDIRMTTGDHLDRSRDPKEYEDSYGIVREQDHHMLFTY